MIEGRDRPNRRREDPETMKKVVVRRNRLDVPHSCLATPQSPKWPSGLPSGHARCRAKAGLIAEQARFPRNPFDRVHPHDLQCWHYGGCEFARPISAQLGHGRRGG